MSPPNLLLLYLTPPMPQLGFRTFVVPAAANVHASGRLKGARIVECRTVVEAFRAVLGSGK